jgi:hypothetical protein
MQTIMKETDKSITAWDLCWEGKVLEHRTGHLTLWDVRKES